MRKKNLSRFTQKNSVMMNRVAVVGLIAGSMSLAYCKTSTKSSAKDDFVAAGAQEYTVTGTDVVHLEMTYMSKSEDERMDRARVLASNRNRAIGYFLQAYIEDKEESDANKDYGRFNADVRFGSDVAKDVTRVDTMTYSFAYSFDVAGSNSLIQQIQANQHITGNTFALQTASLSNTVLSDLTLHNEWFRKPPYDVFDPSKMPADQIRAVQATIVPQPVNPDAFLPVDQMVADGKLTVAIHFGWDGEGEDGDDDGSRHDIDLAKELFETLVKDGFTAPVANFAAYRPFDANAKPLTKNITVAGKPVQVQVGIFFGGSPSLGVVGPDPSTDAGGKIVGQAMVDSLATKRIVMYLGHSGIRRGFNLANWNDTAEGNIPPKAIAGLQMLNSYQLIVAEGCQTYYLADDFWANPAKANHKNLNLITSLGFTDADSIKTPVNLLRALAKPVLNASPKVSDVLQSLNPATIKTGKPDADAVIPVYGLHGVDENPKADPLLSSK